MPDRDDYAFEMKYPGTDFLVTVYCTRLKFPALGYPSRFEWLDTGAELLGHEVEVIYDEAHALARERHPDRTKTA